MSLGIVPIITDIEGNRGVVIDGDSGWVIPAKNPTALAKAITEFVNDPAESLRRGENARKHIAAHFHTEQTVQEVLGLYEKLIPPGRWRQNSNDG
jgi:glycosyltransferase involved in cell wall biosynthesis